MILKIHTLTSPNFFEPLEILKGKLIFLLMLVFLLSTGCSNTPAPRQKQGTLDTPAHHALRGRDLVEQKRWKAAEHQFELALEINPEFSPALAGKALVKAHLANQPSRTTERIELLKEESRELLLKSLDKALNPQESIRILIDSVRVEQLLREGNWIEKCENHYTKALELIEDYPETRKRLGELNFFMGEAFLATGDFFQASGAYTRVLGLNLSHTREANRQQTLVQKIVRARPGTAYAKEIALVAEVTRADLAALLIEEFQLERLFTSNVKSDTTEKKFESPTKEFKTGKTQAVAVASDINEHPLREDITLVLKLKVRGLETNPQHLFFPNKSITRAEYALMLEDILIKVTQDQGLSTRFVGEKSPWSDVRNDAYFYNAARSLTSRGVLEVRSPIRGEFGPNDPVHGADVLLSLRLLKDELKSYVRSS